MMKHQVYHLWGRIIEKHGIDFIINQHHDQDHPLGLGPVPGPGPGLQPRKVVENTQKEKQQKGVITNKRANATQLFYVV